ncbi:Tetraspanin15 [Dorcoceras hygrometricum]|uniref:Tetraspanin15 n=1 Tax=Dorcoceras hygrometricum TaxID=472368 RepID=A0A2Z7BPX6_9LAMI|nr:Tetraspanin15 [Dorcoceras hygrometricum]
MAENTNNNAQETLAITVTEEKNNIDDPKVEQNPIKVPRKSLQTRQLVLPLALVTFLLSIPFLFQAIWLLYVQQYDCEGLLKSLPRLQIVVAIGMISTFVVSNGVVYLRTRFPAPGLILVMVPLVVMFIVGISFGGSFKMETRQIPASPRWLKMKVNSNSNWNNIKSCLYDTRICRDLEARSYNLKFYDFTTSKLSPLESGCCKPPTICEMEYVNATYWNKTNKEMATGRGSGMDIDVPYDEDCDFWKNDETILCYDCHHCKDGFLKTLEGKWMKLGTFLVVVSVLLMISHLLLFIGSMLEQDRG